MPVTLEEFKQVLQDEFPKSDVGGVTEDNHLLSGYCERPGVPGNEHGEAIASGRSAPGVSEFPRSTYF